MSKLESVFRKKYREQQAAALAELQDKLIMKSMTPGVLTTAGPSYPVFTQHYDAILAEHDLKDLIQWAYDHPLEFYALPRDQPVVEALREAKKAHDLERGVSPSPF